jgi:hypothetical protein
MIQELLASDGIAVAVEQAAPAEVVGEGQEQWLQA